jgi:hypothetical protein
MIYKFLLERRELFAGGHEFPVTGAYEKLTGKLYGEVDAAGKRNKVVVNLEKAPRNRRGRVEYSTDFFILKPADMGRGNGKIFYDAPNRGGKRILAFLNDGPQSNDPANLEDAGNGFLMRQGYTIAWCGWQGDLLPMKNWLVLTVPAATDGRKEIARRTRTEIVVDEQGINCQPLSGDERVRSYATATFDKTQASLTVREKSYGERIAVPIAGWEFARCVTDSGTGNEKLEPSATDLYLHDGFKPGHIYELVYVAKNPLVLGLGFAAVRDFVSFLRYESKDQQGMPILWPAAKALRLFAARTAGGAHRAAGLSATSSTKDSTKMRRDAKSSMPSRRTWPAAADYFSITSLPGR